jgi:BirA family biotin operon repressor/biotin-[acetyl-CoA-carboxylase] ligase
MVSWLGHEGEALAREFGLPRVEALGRVGSTMDAAHALAAEGALSGTLVIAEEQAAGRGRGGRSWTSVPRAGLWMTVIERPRDADALDVLSLRVGLHLAPVLERWTSGPVSLKWPNDLYVGHRKLAGVLIEARWRGARADWVAIGVGINLTPPPGAPDAIGLGGADAFANGPLREDELLAFASRDLARGRTVTQPARGTARGISPAGELLVETAAGVSAHRTGSLVLVHS